MLNVFVPNPPDAVIGTNACISTSCSRVLDAIVCTAVRAGGSSTVNRNVSVAVCGTSSVTVIVNVICVRVAVGVPIICPFAEFSDRPAGKLGLMVNVLVPTPPVAVTGVKLAAMFLVRVLAAITLVSTIAGGGGGSSMVRLKVFELVCGTSSVTVTV
jgi:hypothetical protein